MISTSDETKCSFVLWRYVARISTWRVSILTQIFLCPHQKSTIFTLLDLVFMLKSNETLILEST
jgi:hypothetical protein